MGRLLRNSEGVFVPEGHPSLGLAPSTPTALVPTTVSTSASSSSALIPAGSFSRAIGASGQGQLVAGTSATVAALCAYDDETPGLVEIRL